ncbi:unnamed protein product, partial [Mesorhabditis spiculigera]
MTNSSIRYSALRPDEPGSSTSDEVRFGTDPDYFKSAFTYAKYNDLDRMGYQVPQRFGKWARKSVGRFTYTPRDTWEQEDEEVVEKPLSYIELIIVVIAAILAIATMPFSLIFTLKLVGPTEKLVVMRLGRAMKPRGPGPSLVLPCIDSVHLVDTRLNAFSVPPLKIITQDRGLVELGATVYLKVRDVMAAVCAIQERDSSTRTLASTLLYRHVSQKRVCDMSHAHQKRELATAVKEEMGSFTQQYGVEITEVELSEVKVEKAGENMGMAALSAVAKSEVGQQIWSVIGPTLEDIAKEAQEQKKDEDEYTSASLIDLSGLNGEDTLPKKLPQPTGPQVDITKLLAIVNLGIDDSLTHAVGKVYQIHCEGHESFYIDLKHGSGKAAKGTIEHPNVVLHVQGSILSGLLSGAISPLTAYMNGSLRIEGSVQDATSLSHLAQRVSHLL